MTDIERVQAILRRYRQSAIDKNNEVARKDVEHLMMMFDRMFHVYRAAILEEVREELRQTGAMVLRCLVNLEDV